MSRRHEVALVAFLKEAGATDIRVENGSKHRLIRFRWRGREDFHVGHYGNHGDPKATMLALGDLAKKLGVYQRPRGPHRERRRRKRESPRPVSPAPHTIVSRGTIHRPGSRRFFPTLAVALIEAGVAA